jgi:purine nucleoside phosphorylase
LAAGISRENLSHAEVLKTAGQVGTLAGKLLKNFCGFYG